MGLLALSCLLLAAAAQAQVETLGKGWLLEDAGTITSTPGEVISGKNSIRGAYFGTLSYSAILSSDPTFVRFPGNQKYTITFNYRVISALSRGLEFGFYSGAGGVNGLINNPTLPANAAPAGIASGSAVLGAQTDYQVLFKIVGTGAIVIDDIRITDASGRLVASEGAEGPALVAEQRPLQFRLTDGTSLVPDAGATLRSATLRDLDGDGYPELVLTLTAPRPSTTPIAPIVVEASGRMRVATSRFFPGGAPTVKHSPVTIFADINGDGLRDILFADAGSDAPPWVGSRIGVALNLGNGTYRDVSSLIPGDQQTTRSYALAAGDLDGDGRVEIVLPDQGTASNTALLRWNGNGFDEQRNWIAQTLWGYPAFLAGQSWMVVADFDHDGRQDLLIAGQGAPPTPNVRILFGSAGDLASANLVELPDGIWGYAPANGPVVQGADTGPVLVADFDNDGLPDIFVFEEQVTTYQPGLFSDPNEPGYEDIRANGGIVYGDIAFQVLINQGARRFADVTATSPTRNLGRRYYYGAIAIDVNNDGYLDVVAVYLTKQYAGVHTQWSTTVFLNDGTGAFQAIDGTELLAVATSPSDGQRSSLGSFLPTLVTPSRTEGIAFETVGGCGGPGFCAAKGLNLYKVVADGAIGTGPGLANSAALGAAGFNEFFYLRHYPDAAAAVQAGQYPNGLAHYFATGRAKGYLTSAASGVPLNLTAATSGSTVSLSWSAPLSAIASSYALEAGSAPGLSDIGTFASGGAEPGLTFSNVPRGTYYVRVRSDAAGARSAPSNEVVVHVGPTPCTTAPSAPTALTATVIGSTVTLRWGTSTAAPQAYVLEAGSESGRADIATVNVGNTTAFTVPSVGPGTYYGRIRATNACGTSSASSEIVAVVAAVGPIAQR